MRTAQSLPPTRATAVGYLRRSTDRQEQSIPDQKKAVERYAQEHGIRILRFYTDDAISGTSTLGRKAFQQMIADSQGRGCDFSLIIVYDIKRFGRTDNDEAGYYRHLLRMHGVEVRYASENFSGDGTDDLLRPVKQWQAREESKDLSKVTIRGLLSKANTGYWMGGVAPYGYDLRYEDGEGRFLFIIRFLPDGSKSVLDEKAMVTRTLPRGESINISKRDRAKLVFGDPKKVEIVKSIFKMYAEEGKGYRAIADWLNRRQLPTPRGPAWSQIYRGSWTDTTIRAILVNPVYAGDMVWNRRTDGKFHMIEQGRATERKCAPGARLVPNQQSSWITVKDAHPSIVPRRLFEQARKLREERPASASQRGRTKRPVGNWSGPRSQFILSGLLQCARCGNRYQGYTCSKGKLRKDGSTVRTLSYACGGYITKGATVCQLHPVDKEELERVVIDSILEAYEPYFQPSGRKKLLAAIAEAVGTQSCEFARQRRKLESGQRKIMKRINNLLDNITATNRDWVDQRLIEQRTNLEETQLEMEQLHRSVVSAEEQRKMASDAVRHLAELRVAFLQGSVEEKRSALRHCLQRVRIDKGAGQVLISLCTVPGLIAPLEYTSIKLD